MPVTINGTTGVTTPGATVGSITGILKATSGVVSQAVAGTDYLVGGGSAITSTNTAKAWVNFNGTTSPGTIRSSFNVSSVTRNSTGNFTINFTTPMSSSDYVIAGSPDQTVDSIGYAHYESIVSATVNGFTILTSGLTSGANVCNPATIRYCVFGN